MAYLLVHRDFVRATYGNAGIMPELEKGEPHGQLGGRCEVTETLSVKEIDGTRSGSHIFVTLCGYGLQAQKKPLGSRPE